ncbi:hypothetical protein BKA82DRAFT_738779 [Pisolithus tinctorius]|uniref:Heterokaryon incompatibility domain-containing protein n=1 Tax=Pisolithus tinctorius Marx 270 TaxID=870435 RepID=A0A0C3JU71_PISTI|nr:hypothetical protein BKA82DRAFT_738779 [Pisolithus tinctorius]KIO01002.1 hypothetical protein M404DRAFT_738779 [Pisolithus tinctorius Marx 270]
MLHGMDQSHDLATIQLRKNYISPPDVIAAVDSSVGEICCPLVVVDVTTGCLCDETERMRIFKADPRFKGLVSSMTKKVDKTRIRPVVERFFGYVMFSHAWQGNEPSFQDVNVVNSVWDLPDMPLNNKLRVFCLETRRFGHNWAWSDTCCIDKSTSSVLNQSLTSMYKWYANSAATLVLLAGVAHPSKPGDLTLSLWMTRAWTSQELLSPNVIFFYVSEWKPYFGNTGVNSKQSPEVMQELADSIKISPGTIVTFSPDDLGVRENLRLASTRNAKFDEDVAYSLVEIFTSDIRPHYGKEPTLSDISWRRSWLAMERSPYLRGQGSRRHTTAVSRLRFSVYNYNPPSLEGAEMKSCIAKLRDKFPRQKVRIIYNKINHLFPARFTT